MKLMVVTHKPILNNSTPRGAEISVYIIVNYLKDQKWDVWIYNRLPRPSELYGFDLVLTWGDPAEFVSAVCRIAKVPMVLMVRFWKNVAPREGAGFGDLMRRSLIPSFTQNKEQLFKYAAAIVTNSIYSKSVIHRWQPCAKGKTFVSYVPIDGEFRSSGDPRGCLTIVTPEIYGEADLVKQLLKINNLEQFIVVNCDRKKWIEFNQIGENVFAYPYNDMCKIWERTRILLVPNYNSDICGTRRVTIEAFRHGIPVLTTDRSGMGEKVPQSMLLRRGASALEWQIGIIQIGENYERFQARAKKAWEKYNTLKNLYDLEIILLNAANKKG